MAIDQGSASKLLIHVPDHVWIGQISRQFPDLVFEFKSSIPIRPEDRTCNNLFFIKGIEINRALDCLKDHPQLAEVKLLEARPTEMHLLVQSHNHLILYALLKFALVVEFPIVVQNGVVKLEIVGSRNQIDDFIEELSWEGMHVELARIGRFEAAGVAKSLTKRQLEVYQKARAAGYYDTPRRITLSHLASQERISKSNLSVIIQRIHRKLLGEK